MARLNFSPRGYAFQSGIDVLRKSAGAGLAALRTETSELRLKLEAYRKAGAFVAERDDEGHIIWDEEDRLQLEIKIGEEAMMELRKAFVVATYHHWERSVLRWAARNAQVMTLDGVGAKTKRLDHGKLRAAAEKAGFRADAHMSSVVALANFLKHGSAHWGEVA